MMGTQPEHSATAPVSAATRCPPLITQCRAVTSPRRFFLGQRERKEDLDEEGLKRAGLSQAGPWLAGTETGWVASQQLWAPPRTISLARTDIGPGGAAAHLGPGGLCLPHSPMEARRQRAALPPGTPRVSSPHLLLATWGPQDVPCHERGSPPRLPRSYPVAPPPWE